MALPVPVLGGPPPELRLRPWTAADAPAIARICADRAVAWPTSALAHPYRLDDAKGFLSWLRHSPATLCWCIELEGEVAGCISATLTPTHGRADLGYWLERRRWGQGQMTAAARLVMAHLQTVDGLRKVTARALLGNVGSWRVMEKLGLEREGVLRGHILHRGVAADLVVYGKLLEPAGLSPDGRRRSEHTLGAGGHNPS